MSKSCVLVPTVVGTDGVKKESRLFKNLLFHFNNRNLAKTVYSITKGEGFQKKYLPKMRVDELNEPYFEDIIKIAEVKNIVGEEATITKLTKELGGLNSKGEVKKYLNTQDNYNNLFNKVVSFNRSSPYRESYVAEQTLLESEGKLYRTIRVIPRKKTYSVDTSKAEYNAKLNELLVEKLASWGVGVGVLTSLERDLGLMGVTDTSVALEATDGLIELIRIAEGIKGQKALPEEFAHAALEMLGENPLVTRLYNYIHNNGLATEILGDEYSIYYDKYDGDVSMLTREAAGKLVAKQLLESKPYESKAKGLVSRVVEAIKNFLKTLSARDLERIKLQANQYVSSLTRDILSGRLDNQISVENIKDHPRKLLKVKESLNKFEKVLSEIKNTELKRLKIYEGRKGKENFDKKQLETIDELARSLENNLFKEGIVTYLFNTLQELEKISNRLTALNQDSSAPINTTAGVLRDIRNFLFSYGSVVDMIREDLRGEEDVEEIKGLIGQVSNLLKDLQLDYKASAKPLFARFIQPYLGKNMVVPMGEEKGKVILAEDIIDYAERDISFFDRWLDSMADSSDWMNKIFDQAVKKARDKAKQKALSTIKQLQAAHMKLEKSGIKNTEWMYERLSDGTLTGYLITPVNYGEYDKALKEFNAYLKEKYGEEIEDIKNYNLERKEWHRENSIWTKEGRRLPNPDKYKNSKFNQLNTAQKEYYNYFMDLKAQMDSLLPSEVTSHNRAVMIRKDLLERAKAAKSPKEYLNILVSGLKDELVRRTDDTEFGDKVPTGEQKIAPSLLDFEGREVQTLPVYFVNSLEDMNDLSVDATSTLAAYAQMAIDFSEMSKIIDILEVGRDLMREREIQVTKGGNPIAERINLFGVTIEKKLTKKDNSEFISRLDDYFSMQVYKRWMADEGSFKIGKLEIDKAKLADFVNTATSLNTIALNLLSGISNVATGIVMMRSESIAGEYFNVKDATIGDRNYAKELPNFLGNIGKRVKTDKMSLWDEKYDVLQDWDKGSWNLEMDRKRWFSKMFGMDTLFFMQNAGEHWMQTRTSLALANTIKLKSPNGKIVSLWDASEVVPIDKNNPSFGAELKIREGYTKLDGTEWTQEDDRKFSRKTAALNERFHGIYNKADRSAVQRLALGRMAMMFRKWMKPSLNRRFKMLNYNFDLEDWTEGYYRTLGRFVTTLGKDLKNLQFNIVANWSSLTNKEKANIKRALTEIAHWLLIVGVIGLLESMGDDRDNPWAIKLLEYQARRLSTEVGVLIPGPSMFEEGLRLLQSPAAGVNLVEDIFDLRHLVLKPMDWTTEEGHTVVSGKYKGYSKNFKRFITSPVFPFVGTIDKAIDPESSIAFYLK